MRTAPPLKVESNTSPDFPRLLVVGGPNGAGKTSIIEGISEWFEVIIDTDAIARDLGPESLPGRDFLAGRQTISRLQSAIDDRKDVLIESTLSGLWLQDYMQIARLSGYRVYLWFVWVRSVELTLMRIKGRLQAGGHDVPIHVVRRRFERCRANFLNNYRMCADEWIVFENTFAPSVVAFDNGTGESIIDARAWHKICNVRRKN